MDIEKIIVEVEGDGGSKATLEVEYTDELLCQIRARYNMGQDEEVSSELVKLFIEQELRSALQKVKNKEAHEA